MNELHRREFLSELRRRSKYYENSERQKQVRKFPQKWDEMVQKSLKPVKKLTVEITETFEDLGKRPFSSVPPA